MNDLLFYREGALSNALRNWEGRIKEYVDCLPADRVNGVSDDDLVAHVVDKFHIEPLTLHEDRAYTEHAEDEVDVSQDFNRAVIDRDQPCMVKANRITLRVPFTGESALVKYRPSSYSSSPPRGHVEHHGEQGSQLVLSRALPADQDEREFNRWIENELDCVRRLVATARQDVEAFNARLEQQARSAVVARRQQLERQNALLGNLKIPLKRSTDAPTPLPLPKRRLRPLPPARAVEQQYQIGEDDYGFILKILRHQSRSFEQTPGAYRKLSEEELRDVLLSSLNTHFEGDAAGERFRRKGKTDICIEHANRAAFVAECKAWSGAKGLGEAIDQLLGYLTWRDCRTGLILFNKSVKGFKGIQDAMAEHLRGHARFVRLVDAGQPGEWRAAFRAIDDDARLIVVHVFLVDLHAGGDGNAA